MKTCLVAGPEFHGYTRAAATALARAGVETTTVEIHSGHDGSLSGMVGYYAKGLLKGSTAGSAQELIEATSSIQPETILIIKGDWLNVDDLTRLRASAPGIQIVLWAMDSLVNIDNVEDLAGEVDLLAVFEPSDLKLEMISRFSSSIHLPAAFDADCYHPLSGDSQRFNLSFVGAAYPDRLPFLERTIELIRARGLTVGIVGNFHRKGWQGKRQLHHNWPQIAQSLVARKLTPIEVNALYAHSSSVLNMHHDQSRVGFNPRTVEIIAAGRPQILDRKTDLGVLFPENQCALYYTSPEDVANHVEAISTDRNLEKRLRAGAIEYAQPHSMDIRMKELIEELRG